MIVVELRFTADDHDVRLAARAAHRALLEQAHARGALWAAGPWQDDTGALLVYSGDPGADDGGESRVREQMATDPYFENPGVRVESVRRWVPVVGPSA